MQEVCEDVAAWALGHLTKVCFANLTLLSLANRLQFLSRCSISCAVACTLLCDMDRRQRHLLKEDCIHEVLDLYNWIKVFVDEQRSFVSNHQITSSWLWVARQYYWWFRIYYH